MQQINSNLDHCSTDVDIVERRSSDREIACSSPCNKDTNNNNQLTTNNGVTPTKEDILMGRGNTHKNHPGNIAFQEIIKKYRTQYFQIDTLVNKRNTIMDVITECERNGARFLEQKSKSDLSSTTNDDELKDNNDDDVNSNNKDLVWTTLTKERTFRKVSLAIQYRQRCKALATATVTPTPLKKALQQQQTTTSSSSKQNNSPTCCATSINDIPTSNKLLDHTTTIQQHKKNLQSLNYSSSYVSPQDITSTKGSMMMTSTPPPSLLYNNNNNNNNNNIRNRDFELDKSQQQYVDMNRTISNHDFNNYNNTNGYQNDSLHWMKQSNTMDTAATAASSSTPWSSLPMLSHEMNSLPLHPSTTYTIPIRQRNINMYNDYSNNNNNNNEYSSSNMPNFMMHNNSHNSLPYIDNDTMNNNSCHHRNNNVFTSSANHNEDENHYWYDTSTSTSVSVLSPVQPLHINSYNHNNNNSSNNYYNHPTVSPPSHQHQQSLHSPQQQQRRRISSCTTPMNNDSMNEKLNYCDNDVISITEMTVNTMEMKEFHHIVYDTDSDNDHHHHSDTDSDDHSDHHHNDKHNNSTTTNHNCTGTISDILNNDLCMSPISLSTAIGYDTTTINGCTHLLPTDLLHFPLLSEEHHV